MLPSAFHCLSPARLACVLFCSALRSDCASSLLSLFSLSHFLTLAISSRSLRWRIVYRSPYSTRFTPLRERSTFILSLYQTFSLIHKSYIMCLNTPVPSDLYQYFRVASSVSHPHLSGLPYCPLSNPTKFSSVTSISLHCA